MTKIDFHIYLLSINFATRQKNKKEFCRLVTNILHNMKLIGIFVLWPKTYLHFNLKKVCNEICTYKAPFELRTTSMLPRKKFKLKSSEMARNASKIVNTDVDF